MSTAAGHAAPPVEYPRSADPAERLRYFAWLYSPEPQRVVLQALCAIETEISASTRPGLDHHVAHIRLQWWQEEVDRIRSGTPVHPLTQQLAAAMVGSGSAPDLGGLIEVARWDLAAATFETRDELQNYCRLWASAMIAPVAARALPAQGLPLEGLGPLIRESEMLLNLQRDAHAGRIRLPLDELAGIQVEPTRLAHLPWPASLAELLRNRFETTRLKLREALLSIESALRTELRGLTVWGMLAGHQLERAERALPNAPESTRWHALADAWLAWRAARRAGGVSL